MQAPDSRDEHCESETTGAARRRLWAPMLGVALLAAFLQHVYSYDFISDDAFIIFRYARHLAEGRGLVFNPGERVEGFTSLLWTVLLAGFHRLGVPLPLISRILGAAFGAGTLWLVYRLTRALSPSEMSHGAAAIPPLLLASNGAFACWAASGMETPLYAFLIAATFLTTLRERWTLSMASVGALLLTRPEGAAVFAALAVYAAVRYRAASDRRRILLWLFSGAAVLAALFLFRRLYFGDWLPNTYYVKTGGGWRAVLRGLEYFRNYSADHEGLILMAVPWLWGLLAPSRERKALALGAAVIWAGVVAVGGDGLPMYRFALGPLPLMAVLQGLMAADALHAARMSETGRRWRVYGSVAVSVAALVYTHADRPRLGLQYEIYDAQQRYEMPRWIMAGLWLRENAREGDSVAAVPIGAISYYSGLKIVDMMGLTDRHIARRKMSDMGSGWAGHEKHDGAYVLSRRPTYLLLGNVDVTSAPRDPKQHPFTPPATRAVWQRERDILEHDQLLELYEPFSVEMIPGFFLNAYRLRETAASSDPRNAPPTP